MRHKKMIGRSIICVGILALLGAGVLSTQQTTITPTILTIGTADSGGTMYPVGSAIATGLNEENSSLKINVTASSGSSSNVIGLMEGQIDLGLISGDVALCAYLGEDEFAENPATNLRAIGAVYSSMSNWMATADSGLSYVNELTGYTIALGPEDSATEQSARMALEVLGIDSSNSDLVYYGLGSGAVAVGEGTVDAIHGFAGVPISGLTQLSEEVPATLLAYTAQELDEILAQYPAYSRMEIPAGTYLGQAAAVETFGVKCLLCVNADMDEELVYQITKALAEMELTTEARELMGEMENIQFLYEDISIPLHQGAMRFYGECAQ